MIAPNPSTCTTRLDAISGHALHVWCHCGHRGEIDVDRLPHDATVGAVVCRLRCGRCGERRPKDLRIVLNWEDRSRVRTYKLVVSIMTAFANTGRSLKSRL